MMKRFLLMVAAIVVVVAALGVIKYRQVSAIIARSKAMRPPPAAVASDHGHRRRSWQRQFHAVGSLVGR